MSTNKIVYWISTALLCLLMCFSAGMYFIKNGEVQAEFIHLGFPIWIIYPLAIAKILAVIAILTRASKTLLEWAYAGMFFDMLLAAGAHISIGDGGQTAAIIGAVLLLVSYVFKAKAFPSR
ncbi:MAG: hypothetical protein ACI959_001846 [Limisphaerales bacterium]|jgi:hypothetical protein